MMDARLVLRALTAYFRQNPTTAGQPTPACCTVEVIDEVKYVLLRNNYELVAAYQVRNIKGRGETLRHLESIPPQVAACF